jgi:hypothetical protein
MLHISLYALVAGFSVLKLHLLNGALKRIVEFKRECMSSISEHSAALVTESPLDHWIGFHHLQSKQESE